MKLKWIAIFAVAMTLSACIPFTMMRSQDRLGMQNQIGLAANDGILNVVFYNTPDPERRTAIINAMQGANYGPVVTIKEGEDSVESRRVVIIEHRTDGVFGDRACRAPEDGFEKSTEEKAPTLFVLCHKERAFGEVASTPFEVDLTTQSQGFRDFYRQSFRLLTDPQQEKSNMDNSCDESDC